MLQFSMKLCMNLFQLCHEFVCGRDSRRFSKMGFPGWVIGNIGKEQHLVGGGIFIIVETKLGKREIVDPVVLLVRAVCT